MFGRYEMKENGKTKVYILHQFNNSVLLCYFGREKNKGDIHPISRAVAEKKIKEKLAKGYKKISSESIIYQDELSFYFTSASKEREQFLKYMEIRAAKKANKNNKKEIDNTKEYYKILENF